MLEINNLTVSIDNKTILQDIDMNIGSGETAILSGPNGSGKSTLARTLLRDTGCVIETGGISFLGEDIVGLCTSEVSSRGIFLQFQQPSSVEGLSYIKFLKTSFDFLHPDQKMGVGEFKKYCQKQLQQFDMPDFFSARNLNEGFSGGEKKKAELAQIVILRPGFVILDEVDSGLDPEGRIMAKNIIRELQRQGTSFLVVSHYLEFSKSVRPDKVYNMKNGRIVSTEN